MITDQAPTGSRAARGESPESWFHRRATLYVEAQILFHLNEVGVFRLLGEGGRHSASEIATALGLQPGPTDALLDYVFQVDDLLERDAGDRYSLSGFGREVVARYSERGEDGTRGSINMFDVRVGAYGPVWQNLDRMLTGDSRYGEHFQRDGRYAEKGVFKLAMRFWESLTEHVTGLGVSSVLEVGLTTGLLQTVGERHPDRRLYGLDRNQGALVRNAEQAAARGIEGSRWLQADFFDLPSWSGSVDPEGGGLIFSLHFHELMAAGAERFVAALGGLREALPNWYVLAFEQPRLPREDREKVSETLWLYSQSNILIHHLIGNGRILSREAWIDLGRRAGCRRVTDRACDYLGYRAFLFEL